MQIRVFILCCAKNLPLEGSTISVCDLKYPCLHVTPQHLFNRILSRDRIGQPPATATAALTTPTTHY
jgi:hypothetical protein